MPLSIHDKLDWLEKFRKKCPFVIEMPFSTNWRPTDVQSEIGIHVCYVPIREHHTKYFLFETDDDMRRAKELMDAPD